MTFYRMERNRFYPDLWYNDDTDMNPYVTVFCPQIPGHQRGTRDKTRNLSLEVKKPRFGDFVPTVFSDWLITDKVAELFADHQVTGYTLKPVEICNMELPFNLWELVVTGKGGEPHPDCGMFMTYRCEYCNRTDYSHFNRETGLIVDEANWDGSDIFTVTPLPKFILVNEKVKGIMLKNNLKGTKLVRSTDLKRFDNDLGTVSPF